MIKNIIFDWSGTLSDDIRPVYEASMVIFDKFGVKRISFEEFRREFKLPYIPFYKKYLPNADNINWAEEQKAFADALHSFKPRPFPKSHELLEFLFKKGIKMAILSSVPSVHLEKELELYGFAKFFIYHKAGVRDKKEKIMELINECGFNKEETAYVGDMVHDIEAGKKAGVKTIVVTWGYKPKEVLANAKPDFLFESFDEIHDFISEQK